MEMMTVSSDGSYALRTHYFGANYHNTIDVTTPLSGVAREISDNGTGMITFSLGFVGQPPIALDYSTGTAHSFTTDTGLGPVTFVSSGGTC
jgi:hypothetical protein